MDSRSELTPAHIMQVGTGFFASKVLLSAVEIGIFTELAKGPQNLDELAGRRACMPAQRAISWMH